MKLRTQKLSIIRPYTNRWLTHIPLTQVSKLMGEACTFIYHNTMLPEVVAGNHYHKKKKEVFMCTYGELEAVLLDPKSGARVTKRLSSNPKSPDNILLYVPLGIAHAVRNVDDQTSVLTVFSNMDKGYEKDTIAYKVL